MTTVPPLPSTSDLINVMRSHASILEVELPKSQNCAAFWNTLADNMYYNHTLEELGYDNSIRTRLWGFRESDDLDLVNKRGKILKRFARYWKIQEGKDLPDNILGIIGDRLQYFVQNSREPSSYFIDFTDVFDWEDGMYGKSGSCWWGCYSQSVPTFQHGGGWALRFYDSLDDRKGIGRTWILPRDSLLICFNSYGIERPIVSKVLKSIFDKHGITLHYKTADVENSQNESIPYVNGGSGFVMYPEPIKESQVYSEYDLDMEPWRDTRPECQYCGKHFEYDRLTSVNGRDDYYFCDSCLETACRQCRDCNEWWYDNTRPVEGGEGYLCHDCAHNLEDVPDICERCGCYTFEGTLAEDTDSTYCQSCTRDYLYKCQYCQKFYRREYNCAKCACRTVEFLTELENQFERDFITHELETVKVAGTREPLTLTVFRHDNIPHLFVSRNDTTYTVTHDISGLAVRAGIRDLHTAILYMESIASAGDWMRGGDDIQRDSRMIANLRNVNSQFNLQ